MPTPEAKTKPYLRLAWTLIIVGMALFGFERFGLSEITGPGKPLHLDGTLLSILVVAPLALVFAGIVVFMYGRMRRL